MSDSRPVDCDPDSGKSHCWRPLPPLLRGAALPILICAGINLALIGQVAASWPEYLRDYRLNRNTDAVHYVLLGRNWWLLGHYSRCQAPPYVSDVLRTPTYPLFAGGLDILGGPVLIYLAQAGLQTLSCGLLYMLVRPAFGRSAALGASLLLAGDLMLAILNLEAMSEPLFLTLILAGVVCLARTAQDSQATGGSVRRPLSWLIAGGLFTAVGILTRPAALYLPVVLIAWVIWDGFRRGRVRATVFRAILLSITIMLPVGLWIARNASLFSLGRLSNAEPTMVVYFVGAGAYEIQHGMSLGEAQAQISQEFALMDPTTINNHWLHGRNVAEVDSELRAAIPAILRRYPQALLVSSLMGVAKTSFSHNVEELAVLIHRTWTPPGLDALSSGDASSLRRLFSNPPLLSGIFLYELTWNTAAYFLLLTAALMALLQGRYSRESSAFILIWAVLLYFLLTVTLVGCEGYYRYRAPHMPYIYALAGIAAAWCLRGTRRQVVMVEAKR